MDYLRASNMEIIDAQIAALKDLVLQIEDRLLPRYARAQAPPISPIK